MTLNNYFISYVVFLAGLKYMPENQTHLILCFATCVILETLNPFLGKK